MSPKPKVLKFTLRERAQLLAGDELAERDLKRAHEFFGSARPIPESVFRTASAVVAAKASELMFTSRRQYHECSLEVLRTHPYLELATAWYAPDSHFNNVHFTTEEDRDDED